MVDYQAIAELVSQIPVDAWKVLQEIKQRRPAMMLSELIDYSKRAAQTPAACGTKIAGERASQSRVRTCP